MAHPEVRQEGREPLPDHAGESPLLSLDPKPGEMGLDYSHKCTTPVPEQHKVTSSFVGSQCSSLSGYVSVSPLWELKNSESLKT